MKDLTKYFIDLSKCSEEQRKEIARTINKHDHSITSKANYEIKNGCYDELFPLLTHHEYWYCSRYANGKQELTYPEFIKLFEVGESKEVLQVKKSKALSFILGQIDKKIEQINEIDIAHTEGVLIGLKICKELWAQGTISHETIQEEIYHYQEELDNLNSK